MSVSSVNFKSSVGCTPLRKDNNVSFAGRQEEAGKTEAPKSHKGTYIAAGVGLAQQLQQVLLLESLSVTLLNQ